MVCHVASVRLAAVLSLASLVVTGPACDPATCSLGGAVHGLIINFRADDGRVLRSEYDIELTLDGEVHDIFCVDDGAWHCEQPDRSRRYLVEDATWPGDGLSLRIWRVRGDDPMAPAEATAVVLSEGVAVGQRTFRPEYEVLYLSGKDCPGDAVTDQVWVVVGDEGTAPKPPERG